MFRGDLDPQARDPGRPGKPVEHPLGHMVGSQPVQEGDVEAVALEIPSIEAYDGCCAEQCDADGQDRDVIPVDSVDEGGAAIEVVAGNTLAAPARPLTSGSRPTAKYDRIMIPALTPDAIERLPVQAPIVMAMKL